MTHTATARAALVMTIASGLLALTPPAFAAGEDYVPQARLNVAGTDFTSAQAVAHLKRRLRRTAFAICTADWDSKRLMSTEQRECYDTVLHDGLAQIDGKTMEARRQTSTSVAEVTPQEHPTH